MREFLLKHFTETGYTQKINNDIFIQLEDIITLLENDYTLRSTIYNNVEKENHIEDVREEIEYRNQMYRDECAEEDKIPNEKEMIMVNEQELKQIVEDYEDNLDNDDSWHTNLNVALNSFLEQRKGNK